MQEVAGQVLTGVVGAGQLVAQALDAWDLDLEFATESDAVDSELGIDTRLNTPHWVDVIGGMLGDVLAQRNAILEVWFAPRREVTVGVGTLAIGADRCIVEVHASLDVLGDLGIETSVKGDTLEGVALDVVLVVRNRTAERIVHILAGARDVERIVLAHTCLCIVIDPVGLLTLLVVLKLKTGHPSSGACRQTLTGIDELDVSFTVAKLGLVGSLCQCNRSAEVNHWLALGTLLGGDHDDTVGGLRTVGCEGGGILQDAHRLDDVGVDVVHRALEDDAIDNDQRLRTAVD